MLESVGVRKILMKPGSILFTRYRSDLDVVDSSYMATRKFSWAAANSNNKFYVWQLQLFEWWTFLSLSYIQLLALFPFWTNKTEAHIKPDETTEISWLGSWALWTQLRDRNAATWLLWIIIPVLRGDQIFEESRNEHNIYTTTARNVISANEGYTNSKYPSI